MNLDTHKVGDYNAQADQENGTCTVWKTTNNDLKNRFDVKAKYFKKFSSKYGVCFSTLLHIPYFNPERCHVIDSMDNLLISTSKHLLQVWVKHDLLTTISFDKIEIAASPFKPGATGWRMPGFL